MKAERFVRKICEGLKKIMDPDRSSPGVALIMVLWVITILFVVVLEFSFAMRTEIQAARNYQQELQLYAIAEGGIERAVAELVYKHDARIQQMRRNLREEEVPPEQREWITDGREYSLAMARGDCTIRIFGEAGKININQVSDTTLRKILTNLVLREEEKRDIVVDSILDWRDPDDFYRLNGAEDDHYQSLKDPYHCKNANLDSIEELLLVRGVTAELFYGEKKGDEPESAEERVEPVGLKDIFSIYSMGEQIDLNSAAWPVLRVGLGLPREIARLIIKAREEKGFENQLDLMQRVPEIAPFMGEIGRFLLFRAVIPYYTIEVKAKAKEAGAVRGLKVIVKIDPQEKGGRKMIQWLDVFS